MIKKLRVTVDGNTYDVTVELPDDATAPASAANPVSTPVAAAAPASPVMAPAAATPQPPPPTVRSVASAGPGDVPSPLAGRVTAVVVQVGQEVKENDHLLTLEAMKMNTFVFAPKSGKVVELKVAVGDAVEESQAVARIQ
jgi:biotin carboxyl carrier protein